MEEKMTAELVNQIEKQTKKKNPKKSAEMAPQTEPGDNRKYLLHSLKIAGLPKIDTKNIEQLEERIRTYFSVCAEDDMKPSVSGLALALGTDRRRLWEWRETESDPRSDTIKKAYQLLNLLMEDYMQNGKINPVSAIFLMKNNFGYSDKQEFVLTPNSPLGQQKSTEEIEQRYIDSVAEDIDS